MIYTILEWYNNLLFKQIQNLVQIAWMLFLIIKHLPWTDKRWLKKIATLSSETWLDSSISNHELFAIGYIVFRHDQQSKCGGGVLLGIEGSIKTFQFNFTSQSLEIVSAVISSMSKNMLVCVCYHPSNAGTEFHEEFERFLECASDSKYKDIHYSR